MKKINTPTGLPVISAQELRKIQESCPAVQQKQESSKKEAKLMDDYIKHILQELPAKMTSAAKNGKSAVVVATWQPPAKIRDDKGVDVFKYPACETHWAGLDSDGKPIEPSSNGVPISQLADGHIVYGRSGKTLHPEKLPNGKTIIDLLSEKISGNGLKVERVYSKVKGNRLFVIWNPTEWEKQKIIHEREAREARENKHKRYEPREPREHRDRNENREVGTRVDRKGGEIRDGRYVSEETITLDEYMAKQKKPVPVAKPVAKKPINKLISKAATPAELLAVLESANFISEDESVCDESDSEES